MTAVRADIADLRAAADALQAFHELLGRAHQHLLSVSGGILSSLFQGRAQALLQQALADVAPPAAQLQEQLQQIATRLLALRERLLTADQLHVRAEGSPYPAIDGVDFVEAHSVAYQPIDGRPFVAAAGEPAIAPSDVSQGYIGDCYLMASLAALARSERGRQIISDMIRRNPDGTYTVRFYDRSWIGLTEAEAVEVTVTSELPLQQNGEPAFARFGDRDGRQVELWAALIEKAYAQYYGEYDDIVGGYADTVLEELSGVPSVDVAVTDIEFGALAAHFERGDALTVSTPSDWLGLAVDDPLYHQQFPEPHLVYNHVFSIAGVDRATQTVTLRNPWGDHEALIELSFEQFQALLNRVSINPLR